MARKKYPNSFWHPIFWPTWLGFAIVWICAYLPWPVKYRLGKLIGLFILRVAHSRRKVTEKNIQLCFPELNPVDQKNLVRDVFIQNGIGLFETATAWFRPKEKLRPITVVKNGHYMQDAIDQGKGVIILGTHVSTLDLAGAVSGQFYDIDIFYRKHNNPLFEHIMTRCREKIYRDTIDKKDLKKAIRTLRKGNILWYTPDQDFGPKVSVFAPFFGVEAATVSITGRLAKMTGSVPLPVSISRTADNKYQLEFFPPLTDYPSGDDIADATRINEVLEKVIRMHPDQYMWMHRRFKTRPEGEASLYD
jgi:KDO2-lipid IV(A) lauroyltransferase